jgi:hypothetical protein
LSLGLNIKEVNSGGGMETINNKLTAKGRGKLLEDLNVALKNPKETLEEKKKLGEKIALEEKECWLWILRDLRNQGLHRSLINKHVRNSLFDDVNTGKSWSSRPRVSLVTNPQTDLEIIPYLQDSYDKINNLIENIIHNESSLNT